MYLVYDGWFDRIRKLYFKKIILRSNLSPQSKILDFGCGPGDFMLVAQEMGIQADGVDAFPRSVELARARGLNVTLGDEREMGYPTKHFDAIFLQSVVEHLANPLEVLGRLLEYLKPGGLLIISAPTPCSQFWDDPTHVRPFTPKSFKVLGEVLGVTCELNTYVFSFLMGIPLTSAIFYKLMNILPLSLGSNLVAFYRK